MKKYYNVPLIWEAALSLLDYELCRVMWNIHQKEYDSPFVNTGNRFEELKEFKVRAYDWSWEYDDCERNKQPWNFKWRNVRIYWYKHMRRGIESNIELTADMASEMLEECYKAILKYEKKNDECGV